MMRMNTSIPASINRRRQGRWRPTNNIIELLIRLHISASSVMKACLSAHLSDDISSAWHNAETTKFYADIFLHGLQTYRMVYCFKSTRNTRRRHFWWCCLDEKYAITLRIVALHKLIKSRRHDGSPPPKSSGTWKYDENMFRCIASMAL